MRNILLILLLTGSALAADWPTLHRDNQRSGHAAESVAGPYERKWFRDFHDEVIATRVEAIAAGGLVYIPTLAGAMHALDPATGETRWTFETEGALGNAPAYVDGRLLFGSDDGRVYCLNATDGAERWRYDAGASVWTSPAVHGDAVYFGDRAGVFHAVNLLTGRPEWTLRTGGPILSSPSITKDGQRIVFGSEDMHVRCVSPAGRLLWTSAKLGGLSMRDYAPTLWQGLAIVTTNPAIAFHRAAGQNPAVLTKAQKALPIGPEDKIIHDKWGGYSMKLTQRRLGAERVAVHAYLKDHREEQTFYALDLETGKEPWLAPVLYTGGLHNPPTPPTFDPATNELYLWLPTALSNYHMGVPGGAIAVGRLRRDTGLVDLLWHTNGDRMGWAFDFVAPADETQALSLMGDVLLNTHQGIVGGMRRDSLKWHKVYIARDTYAGIFGPATVQGSFKGADAAHAAGRLALMNNEWHGPARGVVSIADGRMFWIAGSQVVCIAGPTVPKQPTGGTKPPPAMTRKHEPVVPAGNVAAGQTGTFDESVMPPKLTAEDVKPALTPLPVRQSDGELARRLRGRLDASVAELTEGEPWAPLIVELGISGEERLFWRTSESIAIVSLALPHLSPRVRDKAIGWLDQRVAEGAPLTKPVWANTDRRREPYTPGPEMLKFAAAAPPYEAGIEDVYALWAYAHHADRWDALLNRLPAIRPLFPAAPPAFDHHDNDGDAAERLNAHLAGTLAYARLLARANDAALPTALDRLAHLASLRVHHELADTRFIRPTRVASHKLHQARLPRYLDLTPDTARILRQHAGPRLNENLSALSHQMPLWHHAFGERMIGGENYTSPPTLHRAIFMALADGTDAKPEDLVGRLDQPWCRADLYFIEKTTAVLRKLDR